MEQQDLQAKTTKLELGNCPTHDEPRPCESCRANAKESPELAAAVEEVRAAQAREEAKWEKAESTIKAAALNCKTHNRPFDKIIETPFGGKIGQCLLCVAEQDKSAEAEQKREAAIEARRKQERLNSTLANSMIAPRFMEKTFDAFRVENEGQKKVMKACRWFLDNWQKCVGLIFIGNRGTGKNHLASALVKEFVLGKGKTALITEAIKIIRAIKESWRKEGATEGEVIRRFVEPDLLVIDEVGVQFGTDTERMFLTEIINDRYNMMRPTILISNLTKEELEQSVGERAVDRFKEGGGVYTFDWESYRGKIK
jgi:DNA replication protein DnaC